ncbi:unnamed protein product [Psylliodes chrysocephalus]|uniref:Xanthine dehydrogenase n=1 Tax=Psylliodes chrysocephalus TaxID=3402493 RepID=A0A9P0CF41_9CUCU|nr:unnamed protein product [Psylliodes chrysocephala]
MNIFSYFDPRNPTFNYRTITIKVVDDSVDPELTLLEYLRNKLRLCGTKLGCGEGGCGACTVMVSKFDRTKKQVIHIPVNACLAPICAMHGLAVTTVEGIGSTKTKLHPVQERIAKSHGSQCGFCTPGIVMSMYTLLRNSPKPSMKDMEVAFQGNLCRCTGYRPIIEAYKTFTEEWELIQNGNKLSNTNGECGMGAKCCKLQNGIKSKQSEGEKQTLVHPSQFTPYDATQEPIFPPELKLTDKYDNQNLIFESKNITWYRPTSLNDLLDLKHKYPEAKIVVGNTEVGVETKFKQMIYPVIIQPVQIPELTMIEETTKGVRVGASATLVDIEDYLKKQIRDKPNYQTKIFKAIVKMMNWFAGKQIRSVGALGSNVMTGSPISDMIPILMAAKATLELSSKTGKRIVPLDNNFFVGYRKSIVKPEEILLAIHIPFSQHFQYFVAYKQARRREDDIAIVNEAVNVSFLPKTNIIKQISFGIGGMSFKTVSAPNTEAKLKGLPWNRSTLEIAFNSLLEDLPLDPGAPGGMILYRRSLPLSLFFKAFLTISRELQKYIPDIELDERELSGINEYSSQEYKSSQYVNVAPEMQDKTDSVQRPLVHMSAYKQATGEAIYCDDIPKFERELHAAFVLSTKAHAKILNIDESEALAVDGVHGYVSSSDLPTKVKWGTEVHDEELFYTKEVTAVAQIIGLIVADTHAIAQKAAKKVKVTYEELDVIVTIEDAIKHKSFFPMQRKMVKGDVEKVFKEAKHVIEGECRIGGQEHFYFETQSCIVVPKGEDDEMEILASTQNPSELSKLVSEVMGVPQSKIITKVKRLGGGFGGKQSKPAMLAIPLAVAARKMNRPIRFMLDRDEDICMTGARHPFYFKYKIAFEDSGKMLACEADLYNNCGYAYDLSMAVMERAVTHFENAYYIPAVSLRGILCKTNLPSNTAFRGFGGPQGMFLAETMAHHIADYLKKEPEEISELNLYKDGDITYYNLRMEECTLDKCWKECMQSSDFANRKKMVKDFNRLNKYKKRGISVIPTKFGIGFEVPFLNQGGALVLIYTDGSVLLTHGGTEMGQGLHTKMIQVASRALEVSVDKIHTSEIATDKVPNTTATAASVGSDLNGMAVLNACLTLKERLRPIKEKNPNGTWEAWILAAYQDRISLAATGYYKTPDIGYNWESGEGRLFNYFTFGAACTEVEIDTLTGDHQVLKTDIVMDLGESLNPAIDVGQIEGAFMQGYGLFVLEEMVYSPKGETLTKGPGTYKIPGFANIPGEFNVSILKGVSNPRAVYSSKAVGEPPLFLGSSVLFAIKNAIQAAREENNVERYFRLDAPVTSAKIRMACEDEITLKIKEPEPGSFKPWNVVV